MKMTKLEKAVIPREESDRVFADLWRLWESNNPQLRKMFNAPPSLAQKMMRAYIETEAALTVYKNNIYQVQVRPMARGMVHLSIKRIDKKPVHDWRDLQQIKNELVGPECEAVELYPAESRRVDTANQYHLWAFADTAFQWPFGFNEGRHCTEHSLAGSVQRAFEK